MMQSKQIKRQERKRGFHIAQETTKEVLDFLWSIDDDYALTEVELRSLEKIYVVYLLNLGLEKLPESIGQLF